MSSPSSDPRILGEHMSNLTPVSSSVSQETTCTAAQANLLPTSNLSATIDSAINTPLGVQPFDHQSQSTVFTIPGLASSTPITSPIATPGPSTSRAGRKPKAHVASACINCKRAHLSCDVNRPCARCVTSGKQDSCHDVQHKKRGRPRLREEADFSVATTTSESAMQAPQQGPAAHSSRRIAATRPRRAESFRSIQSMTSEGSSSYSMPTPGYTPLTPLHTRASHPSWGSGNEVYGYEIPTAFLDLNLDIQKANRSFQMALSNGRDLQGSHLADIAMPADLHSFQTIRSRLRGEREAREPTYMPPILQPGQDILDGITDLEADQLAQGYTDNTYTWSQLQDGGRGHTFTARVRLAKASIYFVVVTLPSFRQLDSPFQPSQQSTMPYSGLYAPGSQRYPPQPEDVARSQRYTSQSGTLEQRFPMTNIHATQHTDRMHSYSTPNLPQPPHASLLQQPQGPTTQQPRLQSPFGSTPTATRIDVPLVEGQAGARGIIESVGPTAPTLRLPPMEAHPSQTPLAGPPPPPSSAPSEEVRSRYDSEDEATPGTYKRRRGMDIDDVLHR